MRPKPKDASEHHGAFGRMRLRYDGLWGKNGTGARYHRFEIRSLWDKWCRTALGKLRSLLTAAGYEEDQPVTGDGLRDSLYVFRRGEDEVRIFAYARTDHEPLERVYRVEHFPNGTKGDDRRPRVTIEQVIHAMSWGA